MYWKCPSCEISQKTEERINPIELIAIAKQKNIVVRKACLSTQLQKVFYMYI